eukprot:3344133-Amphidinium_carterae.1
MRESKLLAWSVAAVSACPGFQSRIWKFRVPRHGVSLWWELPYIALALGRDPNQPFATERWGTWLDLC